MIDGIARRVCLGQSNGKNEDLRGQSERNYFRLVEISQLSPFINWFGQHLTVASLVSRS
jgi:hypothetical protein